MIGRAIQSVLDQSYQDFEIIIVDDASVDQTEEVVRSFADERINYIRHQKNEGGSVARNTGIKAAKGEFIAFLDSDDEWLAEKLEKQMDRFKISSNKVGVIYTGFCTIREKTLQIVDRVIPTVQGNVFFNLLNGCIAQGSTPVIRKDCFQRAGFFGDTLPSCQDWDMLIRLSRHYEFDFIPEVLVNYHLHGARISNDLNAKIQGMKVLVKKYQVDLSKYPLIFSSHLSFLGKLYCIEGDQIAAHTYLRKAIELNPFHLANYFH
ncbi:unnamed protein product, partial [marine sediment metagenome]